MPTGEAEWGERKCVCIGVLRNSAWNVTLDQESPQMTKAHLNSMESIASPFHTIKFCEPKLYWSSARLLNLSHTKPPLRKILFYSKINLEWFLMIRKPGKTPMDPQVVVLLDSTFGFWRGGNRKSILVSEERNHNPDHLANPLGLMVD